jgi:hypothetical protein
MTVMFVCARRKGCKAAASCPVGKPVTYYQVPVNWGCMKYFSPELRRAVHAKKKRRD